MRLLSVFIVVCGLLGACASSGPVMLGPARPAIAPDKVKIYWSPPANFEPIADLNASSHSVFTPGGQQVMDKVIAQLKVEAAKLGANGLMLEGFSDAQTATLGTGVGSQSYSGNSAVGVSAGGAFGVFKKTGRARAIFVPPE
jgi:hypothetical protein